MWTSGDDGNEEEIPAEVPEGCDVYHLVVMCWYGSQPYQFKITTVLSNAEAYSAGKSIDTFMYAMCEGKASSFSIRLRGGNGSVVSRAFTNVVYIEHDIPAFKEVAEDEAVD